MKKVWPRPELSSCTQPYKAWRSSSTCQLSPSNVKYHSPIILNEAASQRLIRQGTYIHLYNGPYSIMNQISADVSSTRPPRRAQCAFTRPRLPHLHCSPGFAVPLPYRTSEQHTVQPADEIFRCPLLVYLRYVGPEPFCTFDKNVDGRKSGEWELTYLGCIETAFAFGLPFGIAGKFPSCFWFWGGGGWSFG